jgi:uncharacterized OsmC-like protein
MSEEGRRTVSLKQEHDFRVAISWSPDQPAIIGDEPPPLGVSAGPMPSQLLLAAVGNCMLDSLLFALRKFKLQAEPLTAEASCTVGRNDQGRQRVLMIEVHLHLGAIPEESAKLQRALDQFEQFCTVGQSVAQGIPTQVFVHGPDGAVMHAPADTGGQAA